MKDVNGREINIGDRVVVTQGYRSTRLAAGTVKRVRDNTATVDIINPRWGMNPFVLRKSTRFAPSHIMVVNGTP